MIVQQGPIARSYEEVDDAIVKLRNVTIESHVIDAASGLIERKENPRENVYKCFGE